MLGISDSVSILDIHISISQGKFSACLWYKEMKVHTKRQGSSYKTPPPCRAKRTSKVKILVKVFILTHGHKTKVESPIHIPIQFI